MSRALSASWSWNDSWDEHLPVSVQSVLSEHPDTASVQAGRLERPGSPLLIRGLRVQAPGASLVGLDHLDQLTAGRSPAGHHHGAGGTYSSSVPIVEAAERNRSGRWRLALPIESWGAKWGAIIGLHSATSGLPLRSVSVI